MKNFERGGGPDPEKKVTDVEAENKLEERKMKQLKAFHKALKGANDFYNVAQALHKVRQANRSEIISNPEIQEAAKDVFIQNLQSRKISSAFSVLETFEFPQSYLESSEIVTIVTTTCIETLKRGGYRNCFSLVEKFNLPESLLSSDDFIAAMNDGIKRLANGKSRPEEYSQLMRDFFTEKGYGEQITE